MGITPYYLVGIGVAFMSALGQIYLKKYALKRGRLTLVSLLDNYLVSGGVLFTLSTILSILAMRRLDYSVFYSLGALNYLFIIILSKAMLGERVDLSKTIGVSVIVVGVIIYSL